MDSNQKCNEILLEWALRSEDGLASGYKNQNNLMILKDILSEQGISIEESENFLSTIINSNILSEAKPSPIDLNNIFAHMEKVKLLKGVYIEPLKSVLARYPDFDALYDKVPTLEKSIAIYNSNQYSSAIDAINKGISDRTLGPGEVALVFLTKGCKSGGQKTGDLILSDGEVVDVKAMDSSKTIRIEYNSIKGFKNLEFQKALTELSTFLRTEDGARDVLLSILNDDNYGIRTSTTKEKTFTTNFLNELNTEEMGSSVFNGLELIGKRLGKIPADKITDYIDLNIGDEKLMLSVKDGKQLLSKLKSKPGEQHVQLILSPIEDKARQITIPKLKKLDYFSKKISLETINKEIINSLHYDGIVIVDYLGKNAKYISKNEMTENLKFVRLSKGVKLEVIT